IFQSFASAKEKHLTRSERLFQFRHGVEEIGDQSIVVDLENYLLSGYYCCRAILRPAVLLEKCGGEGANAVRGFGDECGVEEYWYYRCRPD
ncbi:hypothetical protein ACC793_37090, partial [Rhizobium ruizarguesonis]